MTTEELKHAMYRELNKITGAAMFDPLQSALEAYLEALRIEANDLRANSEQAQAVLIQLKGERDDLRNKLQAFEFANKSAGELLRDALATVKRQREFIRTLYTSRKAKTRKAPEIDSKAISDDDINPYGLEKQIASCRQAVDRWQAIDGATDKQTLLDIVGILRDIPE